MFKTLKILLISILLTGCGFSPVYKNIDNLDIKISVIETEQEKTLTNEDRLLYNYLRAELNKYKSNNQVTKEALVSFETKYEKISIVKDNSGKSTDYEARGQVKFLIKLDDKEENITFSEKIYFKNLENSFNEANYERIIIKNFANSISKKLIFKLKNLNDN